MAQLVSSIPEVVAQIKSLMTTALSTGGDGATPVSVTVGMTTGSQTMDQFVIGDVEEGSHSYVNMRTGRKPREEQYLLNVHVIARRPGEESTAALAAAMTHWAALTDAIADDPAIGLTSAVSPTLRLSPMEFTLNTMQDDSTRGWSVHLKCKIRINCRLD